MKINLKSLMAILFTSTVFTTVSYADWDKECLDDCFSTGHECRYCAYQCHSEGYYHRIPNYSDDTICPFTDSYAVKHDY